MDDLLDCENVDSEQAEESTLNVDRVGDIDKTSPQTAPKPTSKSACQWEVAE